MMVPPQVRYSGQPTDAFFLQAASPTVQGLASRIAATGPLVTSTNVDPMYREANIPNPNYNMPGSAEAHARFGIPPVVVQSDPYATLAFAAGPDGSVAPLIGYPSRYPHVLNGVPRPYGGGSLAGLLSGLMAMGRHPAAMMPPMVQQRRSGGNSGGTTSPNKPKSDTVPDARIPGPTIPPPEVRYAGAGYVPPAQPSSQVEWLPGPTWGGGGTSVSYPPVNVDYGALLRNVRRPVTNAAESAAPALAPAHQPAVVPSPPPLAASHQPAINPADTAAVQETQAMLRRLQEAMMLGQ